VPINESNFTDDDDDDDDDDNNKLRALLPNRKH
jgi:hypothetical protein